MSEAILLGVSGALFLAGLYRVIAVDWPSSYFSGGSLREFAVSRRLRGYVLFRAGPPYAVAVLIGVTASRLHGWGWLAALLTVSMHTLATSGRAALRLLRKGSIRSSAGRSELLIRVLPGFGVLVTVAAASALTYHSLAGLVPGPGDLVDAVWTAAFVAVAAGLLRQFTSSRTSAVELLRDGRAVLGSGGEELVLVAARAAQVDAELLKAILLAEIVQRPRWFRAVENASFRIRRGGTYGIAQASRRPVDRATSIRDLAAEIAGDGLHRSNGRVSREWVEVAAERHHADPTYVAVVNDIYDALQAERAAASDGLSADMLPLISVDQPVRRGGQYIYGGTVGAEVKHVTVGIDGRETPVEFESLPGKRSAWSCCVDLDARWVAHVVGAFNDVRAELANCQFY